MEEYAYTPLYYDNPIQVAYFDGLEGKYPAYKGGIAYQDVIIKGESGERVSIQTIINYASENDVHWDNAIIELDWVNLNSTILP